MANQIPFSGATNAAGGYLLPTEQGDILVNGLLQQAGAIAMAGDKRATSARKAQFGIWLGTPTAAAVGEGAVKPATGGEFSQATMAVKKFASIVLFTDEMIEDVQGGDLNVLVDSGVRQALEDVIDANAIGKDSGVDITGVFDSMLRSTTTSVEYDQTKADGLERAVSAAMGVLEANGYADVGNMAVLLGAGFAQVMRDARSSNDTTQRVYDGARDPLYGIDPYYSTNLNTASEAAAAGKIVAIVAYKPNLHVRIRKDVTLSTSTEATVNDGATDRKLFQEDLTAVRYETRLGYMIHDINRAVVKILNAA
jgi:HK97 family phage major capsid protein